jgi:hypothetical protein
MSTFTTRLETPREAGVGVGAIAAATFFAGMAIFLPILFWISTL